jgi:glutamate formiminotransferase / formiminotetrahydrofolate cyclodeaminase
MKQLIECVPNISEGNDLEKIQEIAHVVRSVKGVQLLNIDSGNAANRTVFTFVGEPENVVEAAFLLIKKASELIDMSIQKGTHPRFGATDVCPLIPIANISMEKTVKYAHKLGEKVGKELGISGYFYEFAAVEEQKKNLASIRSGEYEGLQEKIKKNNWQLDFGPKKFNKQIRKSGITAIGARNFLIAYNLNLNSTSVKLASQIASKIRESGSLVTNENGETVRILGKLKAVKAIGWFLEDFGIAQVSCNLTNFQLNSMHQVFDEAIKIGNEIGVKITGSELIGLLPLQAMIAAADFFLTLENKSTSITEDEKIKIAIEKLNLNDIKPFHPKERIIEYVMKNE